MVKIMDICHILYGQDCGMVRNMEYRRMVRIMDALYGLDSGCMGRDREDRVRWSPAVCSRDCCRALLQQASKADEETIADVGESVF